VSILRTEKLNLARNGHPLVIDLDWGVAPGELWCILGQNGVGKTSLLYALSGLLKPTSGHVSIDGVAIDKLSASLLAQKRGLMLQQQTDAFSHTVLETVLIGRTPHRTTHSWDTVMDKQGAHAALVSVGLAHKADDSILQLSGGERQRVALATLLAQAPDIMLLDEPTAHQDIAQQLTLMRLIRTLASKHALIVSCHDINLAARFATHVLILASGTYWRGSVTEILTTAILEQAFGCRFAIKTAETACFIAY
jgi:iron complex transport system ATP-binding protein